MAYVIKRMATAIGRGIQWREITIPVPWGHIAGKSWGDERSSRKILCLHGWLDNAGSFDGLIPLLSLPSPHVVAIDLPGHGLSSHRPPGTNDVFMSYLTDVRRVIDSLKWDKFSFLCHSMGANVAALYGSTMPEQVEKMVLIEGLAPSGLDESDIPDVVRKALTSFLDDERKSSRVYKTKEEIVQRIVEGNRELTESSAKVLAVRGTKKNEDGTYEFTRDIALKKKSLVRLTSGTIRKFISNISKPTLVIVAKDSIYKALFQKHLSSSTNPMISSLQVEGNHHVHLNQPHIVAEHVSSFLLDTDTTSDMMGKL